LTRTPGFDIIVKLACGNADKTSEANLENDTEKKRAKRKKTAKIPRVKHESVKGLNGRV